MRTRHILQEAPRGVSVYETKPACGTTELWPAVAWTYWSDAAAWRRANETLQALKQEGHSQLCPECLRIRLGCAETEVAA